MSGPGRLRLSAARLELLENMLREQGVERARQQVVTTREDKWSPVALTFSQERYWFLEQMAAHGSAYIIPAALRLRGEVRLDLLAEACAEVVRRHESLRTVFFDLDGQPMQQVRPDLPPEVHIVDLPARGTPVTEHEVAAAQADFVARPFDLANGPPVRMQLLRLADDDAIVALCMHHLVSDRWSMGVFLQELTSVYTSLLSRTSIDLPELPVQYPDFALWQRHTVGEPAWDADVAYWTDQLSGSPSDLGLPTDLPRPRQKSYRGSSLPIELAPVLVTPLRELARAQGVTVFMLLVAAYAVVLSRCAATEDVVIGTPVANRTSSELEPLIGLFVNTVALRTNLRGDPPFRELVDRVGQVCLHAYEHQSVPFERLVERLAPQRSLANTPMFQVMLSYQNVPFPSLNQGGVRVTPVQLEATKAEFDLLLDLFEDGERIWGRLEYSVDIFTDAGARRIASMLRQILRSAVTDPDRKISELSLVGEEERATLVAAGQGRLVTWPGSGLLHERVDERAEATPDAVAVRYGRRELTYHELVASANRLARHLRQRGFGRGAVVGLAMRRCPELVVGMLAVLKSGAAVLGVDPDSPAWLAGTGVSADVWLASGAEASGLPDDGTPVIRFDQIGEALEQVSADDLDVAPHPDDLACVLYTAGSTGATKPVAVSHAAMLSRLMWMVYEFGLDSTDRVLHKAPLSSDIAWWEIYSALLAGGRVVLARPSGSSDCRYLAELIRAEGVTTVHVVPSMLDSLINERGFRRCTGLRRVWCAGESLGARQVARFAEQSRAHLHNLYHTTQTGVVAAMRCQPTDGDAPWVPVGRPAANASVYVCDRFGALLPAGQIGELYVGGQGLARDYAGDPELTGQPIEALREGTGERLYRTGDLGRLTADGQLVLVGRRDWLVRVRGFTVDLGEIQAALTEFDGVHEAAVIATTVAGEDNALVAYVAGPRVPEAAELTDHLAERLPDYLVPDAFVALPSLPRTAIGTLDQGGLPQVELARPAAGSSYEPPRNPTEKAIAESWREALGVPRVGAHDNFFTLGGHSLLAVRLVAQLKSEFAVTLPLREFFDNPTVARIAQWIVDRQADVAGGVGPGGAGRPGEVIVERADRRNGVVLSLPQEKLCRWHPVAAQDAYHNVVTAVVLTGDLDRPALRGALDDVVERHEALRTRIASPDPNPDPADPDAARAAALVQLVDLPPVWPLEYVDASAHDEPTRAQRLRRLVEGETTRGFTLSDGLIRGVLVRMTATEHVLVLVMHHLVTDNWSYGILVRDLCELYEARVLGRTPQLPKIDVQYADLAAWHRKQLAAGAFDEDLDYWREQVRRLPPALTFSAPEHQSDPPATGHTSAFVIDAPTSQALAAIGARSSASLFMVLLATFELLLSTYSNSDDVSVAFPVAGREHPESAQLVGYFVNHLIVAADVAGELTFTELLDQIKRATLAAYAHQGVPLWTLEEYANLKRDPLRILFNVLNAELPAQELHGLRVAPLSLDIGSEYVFSEVVATMRPSEVDLALIMRADEGRLRGMWLFSTQHLDAGVLAAMMRQWERALTFIASTPDVTVARLRERLLATRSASAVDGDVDLDVHVTGALPAADSRPTGDRG